MKKKTKKKEFTKDEKQEIKDSSYWLPIGMCIGISVGTAVGATSNNMGLWLPIGLCLGVALGSAFSKNGDNNKKK